MKGVLVRLVTIPRRWRPTQGRKACNFPTPVENKVMFRDASPLLAHLPTQHEDCLPHKKAVPLPSRRDPALLQRCSLEVIHTRPFLCRETSHLKSRTRRTKEITIHRAAYQLHIAIFLRSRLCVWTLFLQAGEAFHPQEVGRLYCQEETHSLGCRR